MRHFDAVRIAVLCLGFYGAAALAADSGLNLNTQVGRQKVAVHVATHQAAVALQAQGPFLHADINVRNQLGQCMTLVSEMAGVCVPVGPGIPVSPD